MNYHQVIINESGLNTNGTLGNSHFADTSYPSVSLTKGGNMKLNKNNYLYNNIGASYVSNCRQS